MGNGHIPTLPMHENAMMMLLLVVVSLARTSHQPASRTLPTCLQACLQAALHVQSAALQLSQPRKERGAHRPKGDQATIVSRLTKPAALSPSDKRLSVSWQRKCIH